MRLPKLVPLLIFGLTVTASLIWSPTPNAQVCDSKEPQLALQYLRRLSLDLRGHMPTLEEAQQVIKTGKVEDAVIDKMLETPQFLEQLQHYHRDILWANIGTIDFANAWKINRGDGTKSPLYSSYRSERFRGGDVGCLNEPANIDANGVISTKAGKDDEGRDVQQEGYVEVKPYWDPSTTVKVCAFDAQSSKGYEDPKTGKDCSNGYADKSCGCGPNLSWCQVDRFQTAQAISKALLSQILKYTDRIIKEKRPYTELITPRGSLSNPEADLGINGPISHFLRFQTHSIDGIKVDSLKDLDLGDASKVPVIPFNEKDTWQYLKRGKLHSGILTMPAYLLRFPANRSRANQFYNAFLCKPFQAPPGGLPPGQDACHKQPDLQQRCGCKYCHATLEPAAAYWGRWLQGNFTALTPDKYPASNGACDKPGARGDQCNQYITKVPFEGEYWRGKLKAYLYIDDRHKQNIEEGPKLLAQSSITSGAFASCVSQKMWSWFAGNPPLHQQTNEDLALRFKITKYDLKGLVKIIVKRPEYRLGRLYTQK